jgi:hypothetical protein
MGKPKKTGLASPAAVGAHPLVAKNARLYGKLNFLPVVDL